MTEELEKRFLADLNEHERIIHRVCRIYFPDGDDRKDAFQETVYQAWRSYGNFRGRSKFSTWLYRVALNTALTLMKRRENLPVDEHAYEQVAVLSSPGEQDELIASLYRAIGLLSPVDKAVVMLQLEEMSYAEIADVTGLSSNNISVRLVRIRKKLGEKLKNQFD